MNKEKNIYDITIVGGGPVGLFTATYALMRQGKVQIIESLSEIGGQVSALFPSKQLFDIPAFPKISGTDLITNLEKQLDFFKPEIHLNETVINFQKEDNIFKIQTNKRTTYSKTIILATGVGAFEPRKLKIKNAEYFENKSLFYNVSEISKFKNKNIIIAGGGDSATDWTLELSKIANHITLIHRRDQFRALESSLSQIKKLENVSIVTPFIIDQMEETTDKKLKLILKRARTKDEFKTIVTDSLIVNYGFMTDTSLLKKWNLEIENRKIKVNSNQETSIKGVYAVGDNAYQDGAVDLIATGFGAGPIAVNHAMNVIYPDKRQATHSTQLMKNFKN